VGVFVVLPQPQEKLLRLRKAQRLKEARQQLLLALEAPMGFHAARPLAAQVLFRACLHWRSFEPDKSGLFDQATQVG
jgi:hypothetical protein